MIGYWKRYRLFPWVEYRDYDRFDGLERYTIRRWRWSYREPVEPPAAPVVLPERLLFDWHRDYAPLWEPGSTAFWLEPEPGDLEAGKWPLPFTENRPSPINGTVKWYPNLQMTVSPVKIVVTKFGT